MLGNEDTGPRRGSGQGMFGVERGGEGRGWEECRQAQELEGPVHSGAGPGVS
jgi:hypothetical protein